MGRSSGARPGRLEVAEKRKWKCNNERTMSNNDKIKQRKQWKYNAWESQPQKLVKVYLVWNVKNVKCESCLAFRLHVYKPNISIHIISSVTFCQIDALFLNHVLHNQLSSFTPILNYHIIFFMLSHPRCWSSVRLAVWVIMSSRGLVGRKLSLLWWWRWIKVSCNGPSHKLSLPW